MAFFTGKNKVLVGTSSFLALVALICIATGLVVTSATDTAATTAGTGAQKRSASAVLAAIKQSIADAPTSTTPLAISEAPGPPKPAAPVITPPSQPPKPKPVTVTAAPAGAPKGVVVTCDTPAQIHTGTESRVSCRFEVGPQFTGFLGLSCHFGWGNCRMDPARLDPVPGKQAVSTIFVNPDPQAVPGQVHADITYSTLESSGTTFSVNFELFASASYVPPVHVSVRCSPDSFTVPAASPLKASCSAHIDNYRGTVGLIVGGMVPAVDAPSALDMSSGDANFTLTFDASGVEPGEYTNMIALMPGPDTPAGTRWGDGSSSTGLIKFTVAPVAVSP
jgi:hypothetical protein